MFRRLMKKLAVKMFGPPLCGGCAAYSVNCIGRCGKSDEERVRAYLAETDGHLSLSE